MAKPLVHTDVDAKAVLYAFKKLPKEVQREIRQQNRQESNRLARVLEAAAVFGNVPPQAALIAQRGGVKPRTDRNIRVDVGGSAIVGNRQKVFRPNKKTGKSRKTTTGTRAGAIVWGAEMGSSGKAVDRIGRKMGNRFVREHSSRGYWLQPTLDQVVPDIMRRWKLLIQRATERTGNGVS